MFVGHQHLVKNFKALMTKDRLSHGYIFFGEPAVGKAFFARHLANTLETGEFEIGKRLLQDTLFIDAGRLSGRASPSAGAETNEGGIETMRSLKSFVWKKPAISSRRLAIVDSADSLTTPAQNAILKVAEEPPPHATIILIAHHLENLLPPLVSRMHTIYFGKVTDSEMKKLCPDAALIASAQGRPGRMVRARDNPLVRLAGKYGDQFLKASERMRADIVKNMVEDDKENPLLVDYFFEHILSVLRTDVVRNHADIHSILLRLTAIKQYNTNKRLQLMAI
ncbi:MAG: hypothetical protein Q8R26_00165 [bacterium]|nr:hypothetical protein [bacterium]